VVEVTESRTAAAVETRYRRGGSEVMSTLGATVRFGELVANNNVSLTVRDRMVTALIGPNGAGKTTFFNALTGAVRPSAGRFQVLGNDVGTPSPPKMARLGVIRTFQNLKVLGDLTVRENVELGAARNGRVSIPASLIGLPAARRWKQAVRESADWAMEFVDVGARPAAIVGDLPYGVKRRLEIARALAARPRVLLLDEPTAGMDLTETLEIGDLISRTVDELGIPVLVVEHDMRLVRQFADVVHVLDCGQLIASGRPDEVLAQDDVISVYLGRMGSQVDA
jgi:branched-chain amino acid transport system ATP-binding protein